MHRRSCRDKQFCRLSFVSPHFLIMLYKIVYYFNGSLAKSPEEFTVQHIKFFSQSMLIISITITLNQMAGSNLAVTRERLPVYPTKVGVQPSTKSTISSLLSFPFFKKTCIVAFSNSWIVKLKVRLTSWKKTETKQQQQNKEENCIWSRNESKLKCLPNNLLPCWGVTKST